MSLAFKTNFSQASSDIAQTNALTKFKTSDIKPDEKSGDKNFMDYLKDSIQGVNEAQKVADKMAMDVATGKNENIHETMLAVSHAELSFNFMVQIRNKALEAYQEIMRMPV